MSNRVKKCKGLRHGSALLAVMLSMLSATVLATGGFDLSRHVVAGGGITSMAADGFSLDATAGQSDAGQMAGEGWELVGGFWAVVPQACHLPADMNGDGVIDALDIQRFVDCLTGAADACDCARLDEAGGQGLENLPIFVDQLLLGSD